MDRRLMLDEELREILQGTLGTVNIYFQPTEEIRMKYDAIVYKQTGMAVRRANNYSYLIHDEYQVTVISRDPESELPRKIQERFMMCTPGKKFMSDNLYHFPFTIYY